MVNEMVVVVEAFPPLITSISISPISSSSLSRLGFTPRIRTFVLCLSKRGVWKVPSPSSWSILCPVRLSCNWKIDFDLFRMSILKVSASKPVLKISKINGLNSPYSANLGIVESRASPLEEFAIGIL